MVGNTLYYMKKRKQNIPIYCIMDTVCNGIGQEAEILFCPDVIDMDDCLWQ